MNNTDFKEYIAQEQPSKLILLHHWDTDGLGCAAMFRRFVQETSPNTEVVLMNPTINNYFLVEKEYEQIAAENAPVLLTTDINFPLDVIERLEEIVPQVYVFDHHVQTDGIGRPGIQDVSYPGCTILTSEYLGYGMNLLAFSGMIGDQEDRVTEFPNFYPKLQEVLKAESLSLDDAMRMTKLIDTTYIVGEVAQLHYAIDLLAVDPKKALTDEKLLANDRQIKTHFDRELEKDLHDLGAGMLYQRIESRMSLISEVTRARAKASPDNVIVTDQIWDEMASFYVRRRNPEIDLSCVVDLARSKGFNAGGKPEVAGVVLPTEELSAFRTAVIELLTPLLTQ